MDSGPPRDLRVEIDNTGSRLDLSSSQAGTPTEEQLQALIAEAVPSGAGLRPIKGFKLDLSANPGFRKVFFSTRCDCGTAALLSVEVAEHKTLDEIEEALPSLVAKLEDQASSFRGMPCDVHKRMRLGRAAG